MLQVRTEEQKKKVLKIFGIQETCCHFPLDFDKETYGLEVIGNIYDNIELLSTK